MQRYFALDKKDNIFALREDDYYHIKVVMKLKIGEKVEVVYKNEPYLAQIIKDYKIEKLEKLDYKELKLDTTLIIPLLKEQKMDFIFQKSTELGISNIILFNAKRSIIKLDEKQEKKKIERWNRICKEASEQSKRCTIPTISFVKNIKDLEKLEGLKLICSTIENTNNLKKVLQANRNCVKISMIVGPEGGFEPNEEQNLINLGFVPVTLGDTIMRVETVPIFLLSILNYENME
jgi:16S rRNA (uracil1498-N3)-methyltransferase